MPLRLSRGALVVMVMGTAWLAIVGEMLIRRTSVTVDEVGHFAAGVSYWRNGNYGMMTGNFFFTQKWAAWPVARRSTDFPSPDAQAQRGWNPSKVGLDYLVASHRDPREVFAPSRRMTLLLCAVTAVVVAGWATSIAGWWAGAVAMLLFVTNPVVLANGVLMTTDTGAALWFVVALIGYAALQERPGFTTSLVAGGGLALLALSKFTLPVWILAAAGLLLWSLRRRRTRNEWLVLAGSHLVAVVSCWTLIWLFFGFEFRPGGLNYLAQPAGNLFERTIMAASRARLLPEPMLSDLFTIPTMVEARASYLLGDFRIGGHWLFFPVVFAAKSTIALLLALGSWLAVRKTATRSEARPVLTGMPCVIIGLGAYALLALASPVNIGVRHILPLYALASVAGGVALARLGTTLGKRLAVAAVALLAVIEAACAYPRPQSWFNLAFGGPMHGYRIAIDSTLEWGGDVADLVAWQASLPPAPSAEPVFVNALGPPIYECYGLHAEALGFAFQHRAVRPGYFIFSATRLLGGSYPFYGAWTPELGSRWQREGADRWQQPLSVEQAGLACSRLAAYCRARLPMQRIGPVYFVYHLDAIALAEALGPQPRPR